jgi:hypothetical protein
MFSDYVILLTTAELKESSCVVQRSSAVNLSKDEVRIISASEVQA